MQPDSRPSPVRVERRFLGAPSTRPPEHFDWLLRRPAENALTCEDDIRFDVAGRERVANHLI